MRGIHRKRFRGRIATIERPDLELDVELWIEERDFTIARKDKPLGSWPIELVAIDRVGSARFVITLDGEPSAFVARDPIAFSYEGLKAISTAKEKAGRRRLRRRKSPVPSLQAILVARVQGLARPDEPSAETWKEPPAPAAAPPPPTRARPATVTRTPPSTRPAAVAGQATVAEKRDPYEPVQGIIAEPEPVEPVEVAQGARRNPGVFDRVRNARSGIVHEHVYTERSGSAGLTRRVCNECGHVSIDISE